MKRAAAAAKINLALAVGPLRDDGKHDLVTVYQRVALSDRIAVEHSAELRVTGFPGDTLVRRALELVADGDGTRFAARIEKRIPIAAGLGGGSSDAATALRLANELRLIDWTERSENWTAEHTGTKAPRLTTRSLPEREGWVAVDA